MTAKARSAIRRMIPLPKEVTSKVYRALIQPLLDYCDVAWSPKTCKLIDKLERVQKLATRLIMGTPKTARTAELYSQLRWITLEQRRKYRTAT